MTSERPPEQRLTGHADAVTACSFIREAPGAGQPICGMKFAGVCVPNRSRLSIRIHGSAISSATSQKYRKFKAPYVRQ
jgi:hypothetical protein